MMRETDQQDFEAMVGTLEDQIRHAPTPATREAAIACLEEVDSAGICWALGLARGFAGHAELAKQWLLKLQPEEER
jgi:hypothetical protein